VLKENAALRAELAATKIGRAVVAKKSPRAVARRRAEG
jgi:hypothetical protein